MIKSKEKKHAIDKTIKKQEYFKHFLRKCFRKGQPPDASRDGKAKMEMGFFARKTRPNPLLQQEKKYKIYLYVHVLHITIFGYIFCMLVTRH